MSEVGNILREKRESLGLSLKDIAKKTNIREQFLTFIEQGEWEKLPSFVHAYGFLKQYAQILGVPFAEIQEKFDAECTKETFGKPASAMVAEEAPVVVTPSPAKKEVHLDINWVKYGTIAGVAVLLFVAVIFLFRSLSENSETVISPDNLTMIPPVETLPVDNYTLDNRSVIDNITSVPVMTDNKTDNSTLLTPPAGSTATAAAPAATVTPANPNDPKAKTEVVRRPVTVQFTFTDRCWVRMRLDNGREYDFIATPGMTRSVTFERLMTVDIGNAAALQVKHGTQSFSGFGEKGVVAKGLTFRVHDDGTVLLSK